METNFEAFAFQPGSKNGHRVLADRFQLQRGRLSPFRPQEIILQSLHADAARDGGLPKSDVLNDLQIAWVVVFIAGMNLQNDSLIGLRPGQRFLNAVLVVCEKPFADFVSQSSDVSVGSEVGLHVQGHVPVNQREASAQNSPAFDDSGQAVRSTLAGRDQNRTTSLGDVVASHNAPAGHDRRFRENCFQQPTAVEAGRTRVAGNSNLNVKPIASPNERRQERPHNDKGRIRRLQQLLCVFDVATSHVVHQEVPIGTRRRVATGSVEPVDQPDSFQHDTIQARKCDVLADHRDIDAGFKFVIFIVFFVVIRVLRPHHQLVKAPVGSLQSELLASG